jgi:hypothetical protein
VIPEQVLLEALMGDAAEVPLTLADLVVRPSWRPTPCAGMRRGRPLPLARRECRAAKALCERCLVVDNCLAYTLEHAIADGIWGGTAAPRARQVLRRAQDAA